jgi:bud site selection protein 20
MAGGYKRKKVYKRNKVNKCHNRLSSKLKDLDQIYEEVNNPKMFDSLVQQPVDPDLPGFGQFYCVPCA